MRGGHPVVQTRRLTRTFHLVSAPNFSQRNRWDKRNILKQIRLKLVGVGAVKKGGLGEVWYSPISASYRYAREKSERKALRARCRRERRRCAMPCEETTRAKSTTVQTAVNLLMVAEVLTMVLVLQACAAGCNSKH